MDYEKKYNEALSQARFYYGNCPTEPEKKKLENIFPELRESEDERIRKEIINYLDFAESHNLLRAADYEKKKGWLAYLEKQKELPFVKDVMLGYPGLYFYDGERMHFRGPAMEEKQKEQKPAEWSEEDKEMLGKVLECIRFAEDHYQLEQEETNGVAVKSWLLDHIIFQPKREWGEEDENIIHNICDYLLGVLRLSDTTKEKAIVFLNSLRPPKGWKEGWCEDCKVRYNHWKPSEEQMNYLCSAVDAAIRKHNESVSGYEPARVLKSLYEDLKKL